MEAEELYNACGNKYNLTSVCKLLIERILYIWDSYQTHIVPCKTNFICDTYKKNKKVLSSFQNALVFSVWPKFYGFTDRSPKKEKKMEILTPVK